MKAKIYATCGICGTRQRLARRYLKWLLRQGRDYPVEDTCDTNCKARLRWDGTLSPFARIVGI